MTEPLKAVEADAETLDIDVNDVEQIPAFTLRTALGEAEIRVPPVRKWRSVARHALFTTGDEITWGQTVLSADDLAEWQRCDPDVDESAEFFGRVMAFYGEDLGKSAASPASSRSTRRR